jgi:N-acetylglucosaminyldiphosphoundecaprenol N-acetyl-beta-D-mannosaminyltransferase
MNMRVSHPFGLKLSMESAQQIAEAALRQKPADGVSLVLTPNIDHIATIRRSPALARAYRNAARIVCDGWPVQTYARWCGLPVGRVTGCEITAKLMRMAPSATSHRLFFAVDSATTEHAVRDWAMKNQVACDVSVPPFGFERDAEYCRRLVAAINKHETTVLIMAVGAPRSEVFVDTYRSILPPCWAFCVGQAVKVELGLVTRASPRWQSLGMEWLWRLRQEPARLTRRYLAATVGFSFAILEDQLHNLRAGRS